MAAAPAQTPRTSTPRRLAAVAGGAALLVLLAAAAWLPPPAALPAPALAPRGGSPAAGPATPVEHQAGPATPQPPSAAGDPLLQPGLRDTLEALLLDAGEAPSPQALKQRLAALVGQHFAPALATRALALAQRYVDYRVALGALAPPRDATDPHALRTTLDERRRLRERHFDSDEYAALFSDSDDLDRLTLARLEVQRNPQLAPADRAAALRAAEAELPAERRAQRAQGTQHLDAAAQTATLDAQGADAYARHTARSTRYGDTAAHALAQLDRDEQAWQARLADYAQARASQDEAALQALRQRLFTPEEQLRLDAALALRAAGTPKQGGS